MALALLLVSFLVIVSYRIFHEYAQVVNDNFTTISSVFSSHSFDTKIDLLRLKS